MACFKARPLVADVTDGGEPVVERDPERPRRAQRPIRHRLLQELHVVVLGGGVPLQQRVRVRVDESRHHRVLGQIDRLRVGGNGCPDARDPAVLDDHDGSGPDLATGDVEQTSGADNHHRGRALRGQRGEERGNKHGTE